MPKFVKLPAMKAVPVPLLLTRVPELMRVFAVPVMFPSAIMLKVEFEAQLMTEPLPVAMEPEFQKLAPRLFRVQPSRLLLPSMVTRR